MLNKIFNYLLSLIFIGILLFLIVLYVNKLQQKYPDTKLQLSGQLDYIDERQVEILLNDNLKNNLWKINLAKVKEQLYANSLIDLVYLKKIWPNILQVKIVSATPIARLNDNFILTSSGKVLSSTDQNYDKCKNLKLPNFYSKFGKEDLMIRTYLLLLDKLSPLGLIVSKVNFNENQGIEVSLNDSVTLKLGTFDLSDRIHRFILAYKKKLKPLIMDIAYIDLRYTNGVAVYWSGNSNLGLKNAKEN